MTWKSKCSYWTLLRPKYCAPPLTGSARMSAPNDAASATRREAIRIIVQSRGRTATEDLHGDATATPHAAKKGKDGAPFQTVAVSLPVRASNRSQIRYACPSSSLYVTIRTDRRITSRCRGHSLGTISRHDAHTSPCATRRG